MLIAGVDENGMGPRLGPLVATSVVIEVPRYQAGRLRRRGLDVGIGDSKNTSGFGKMADAEGLALALVERLTGSRPESADALFEALSLDGLLDLRGPCPTGTRSQCWEAALPLPAFGGDPAEGHARLARLERGALRIRRVRSAIACAGVLNRALDDGQTKLAVDLGLFERLLLDGRRALGEELEAICGMVGGIRRYPSYFQRFRDPETLFEERKPARCAYRVPDLGVVRFEVSADDTHLPVALASMVGKYVRELTMDRIVQFYRDRDEALPAASGYHDPVTTRFIDGTATMRRRLRITDDCFIRRG